MRETREEIGFQIDPTKLEDVLTVRERDGGLRFIRNYARYHEPIDLHQIRQLPEHDLQIYVQPSTALRLVTFEPHRQAILVVASSELAISKVA